jgi:plastocyanin
MALVTWLLAAPAASADETITARPPNSFAAAVTTIDQGEKVTLRNADVAGHDVTSTRKSDDGKPLFLSELVAPGSSGPVVGTEYLVTGTYPFVCTVHPGMDATLEVTSSGEPVPRPDPPELKLKVVSSDLQRVVRDGRLKVRVRSTAATVKLVAKAKRKLGATTVKFGKAGARTVALKLSKAGRKALRGRKRAKVTVTANATDAAGQTTRSTASRTLR